MDFLGFNLLDVIIFAVIIFYLHEGYMLGFTLAFIDLSTFIISFILALKLYSAVGQVLVGVFDVPIGFANAGGFFLIAFLSELILSLLFRRAARYMPNISSENRIYQFFKKIDHFLGIFPGALSAFIILAFILSVIVSLPSSPLIKNLVTGSQVGSRMIANTHLFESKLNDIFGGALNESLNFITVRPESDEAVNLHFKTDKGTVSKEAEQQMFEMVNDERVEAGLELLVFDNSLRDVGRAHSRDMFERGYFSHYTPEKLSPFDRIERAGIKYLSAGENLALAPSTELAMQGLMNSPGHRRNILSPDYGKVGIGAIDGGIYGTMYTQVFSN